MERSSKWAFLVYPDSVPEDWLNLLDNTNIPMAISPKHEPDLNGTEEEKLKQHWHVVVDFGKNLKSQKQVNKIGKELVNGTDAFIIESPIGYYEYLIHKNNPEKQQFKNGFEEIVHINGFDLEKYQQIDKEEKNFNDFLELLEIIENENFTEFYQISSYCLKNDIELLKRLRRDSYYFNSYLRSRKGMNVGR